MNKIYVIFLAISFLPLVIQAQKVKDVEGTYSYILTENDNITIKEAKHKCIELAKADAIKSAFGEFVTSDIISSNVDMNGEDEKSFFWENTVAMAKGEWLSDKQPPDIKMEVVDNHLVFTATVRGKAREIIQSNIDLKWEIQRDMNGKKIETDNFNNGERIYVRFKSPANGYVAIYLIEGTDETSCLLPYRKDTTGRFEIERGKEYVFFDKETDPRASYYKLKSSEPEEFNQIVLIYSPNPFTKCMDITGDEKHPNSLSTSDFQNWLLKCQRNDRDMVVNKKWVKISSKN